jgi:hypothetical protein
MHTPRLGRNLDRDVRPQLEDILAPILDPVIAGYSCANLFCMCLSVCLLARLYAGALALILSCRNSCLSHSSSLGQNYR